MAVFWGMKRWRHKKSGGAYTEVGRAKLQTGPRVLVDMDEMVVYRSEKDGGLWVRSQKEFEDGRFEPIGDPNG